MKKTDKQLIESVEDLGAPDEAFDNVIQKVFTLSKTGGLSEAEATILLVPLLFLLHRGDIRRENVELLMTITLNTLKDINSKELGERLVDYANPTTD